MTRTNFDNGCYMLTASDGFDLVALDMGGAEAARSKSVIIPIEGSLFKWAETIEKPPEASEEDEKARRIAELKAELAALEAQP